MPQISKIFSVFDCDAHVNDPLDIWNKYVPESKKELVRQTYWRDDNHGMLNGDLPVVGGGNGEFAPMYNPICIAGPQMSKRIMRKLMTMMPLSDAQRDYLEHKGSRDPDARVHEMDLMGIDQVLVIPTMTIWNLPFAENIAGAIAYCEAYNNWVSDWCHQQPERLYPAAILPLQSPADAANEVHRVARKGFRVVLMRPIDAMGRYPNDIDNVAMNFGASPPTYDILFRAIEESGMVLGVHTFPANSFGRPGAPGQLTSPGELITQAGADSQTLSFIYEAQTWLAQVLLAGFLDRYPKLKMAIFESNAQWLPYLLETSDRLFKLYANERERPAKRLPSEAFYSQCIIAFESDEEPMMRQWDRFENIGMWSSDCYHHDAADAWSAIRRMRRHEVPEEVQAKLMGGNARRFYWIEPKLFVTDEPPPIARPAWFPAEAELETWSQIVADPRRNRDQMRKMGLDPARFLLPQPNISTAR